MAAPQLLAYIKEQIKQGASNEEIKQQLLEAGWRELDIDEAFTVLGVYGFKEQPGVKIVKKPRYLWLIILIIMTLLGLGIIGAVTYYFLFLYKI
jgi:hypothetical protein